MSRPAVPSPPVRWALVIGLWIILLVLLGLVITNFGVLAAHLPGLAVGCLSLCGVVIIFSLVAAAISLSADTIRGRFPS
jgi:hypothetical protein